MQLEIVKKHIQDSQGLNSEC